MRGWPDRLVPQSFEITMHQVFLDSNSYLVFYSLSSRDILELNKLAQLLEMKKLSLLLPDQVIDEVRRNRAKCVADRIKPLQEARLSVSIPQMVLETEIAKLLKKCIAETQRAHTSPLTHLRASAHEKSLAADELIQRLFSLAVVLKDEGAIRNAGQRKALGNPPGKGNSLGDGVNWEILLAQAPQGEPLSFVSADGDFSSPLDDSEMDDFLLAEWITRKNSVLHYYRDIKQFLDDKFPQIRLASDVRKYFLIDALIESTTFAQSHSIVAELNRYDSFTPDEASRVLTGGMENNQVRWLATDDDLRELLGKVLSPHRTALPKCLVDRWDYVRSGQGHSYGPVPTDQDLEQAFSSPEDE